MTENEGQIDQSKEVYNQELSKIESYYTEKGGVGSPDFIAFGDALRNSVLDAQLEFWGERAFKADFLDISIARYL